MTTAPKLIARGFGALWILCIKEDGEFAIFNCVILDCGLITAQTMYAIRKSLIFLKYLGII